MIITATFSDGLRGQLEGRAIGDEFGASSVIAEASAEGDDAAPCASHSLLAGTGVA